MFQKFIEMIDLGSIDKLYIIGYFFALLIIFVLFCFFLHLINKSKFKLKKNMENQYDRLFYYLSRYQYKNSDKKTNTYIMEQLFAKKDPKYSHNYGLIISKIQGLNSSLNESVVSDTELLNLKKLNNRLKWKKFLKTIVLSFIILIFIAFIFSLIICIIYS